MSGNVKVPSHLGTDQKTATNMPLRDWFAGMAIQGQLEYKVTSILSYKDLAEYAYKIADAMIEVSQKEKA